MDLRAVHGIPSPDTTPHLAALARDCLGMPRLPLSERLGGTNDPFGLLAYHEDRLVGFKLGFSDRPGRFYSWLGAVHPDWRRQGIARTLLRAQHARCSEQGYRSIRTHTTNARRAMLLLNIREGFDIIGTTFSRGQLRLVLEKPL